MMQAFDAHLGNQHQFSGLNTRLLVLCDDVGLNDDGHTRLKGEAWDGVERPALATQHGWQISTNKAVDEVVARRKALVLDHTRGCDDVLGGGSGSEFAA